MWFPEITLLYIVIWKMINTLGKKRQINRILNLVPLLIFFFQLPPWILNQWMSVEGFDQIQYLLNLFYCWYDLYLMSMFSSRQWAPFLCINLCCVYWMKFCRLQVMLPVHDKIYTSRFSVAPHEIIALFSSSNLTDLLDYMYLH